MRFRVAIPARFQSSRLPGKPLLLLAGKPILQHVYERACASGADDVVIATDDQRIATAAQQFGARVCMTADSHKTGTDRLAEVAEQLAWPDDDIIVNLQGDEPLMPAVLIRQVAQNLATNKAAGIATLCIPIHDVETLHSAAAVKVVMDAAGFALYFSRATIPHHRQLFAQAGNKIPEDTPYFHHLGIYAYRAEVLRNYPKLKQSAAEQAEQLEQLRALWYGIRIHVQLAREIPSYGGIDTMADLTQAQRLLQIR